MSKHISKKRMINAVHKQLTNNGYSNDGNNYYIEGKIDKQRIREFHSQSRRERLLKDRTFLEKKVDLLENNLAYGDEIDPKMIKPLLIRVASETPNADLFRITTYLWSIPVSQGFGRRMRFLVKDKQNNKLIGIFALGDPVFNLSARDDWIGWSFDDRKERLAHVMDAFVVGAVPPYSYLICGKLVAALMGSTEVKATYERKYLDRTSIISGKRKRARLALITTTSAMGRSSLYNRLKIPNGPQFIRLGYTRGFGHFHISEELFEMMRCYLDQREHPYASGNRFGMGPNWRIRVIRTVLEDIGLDGDAILQHGIQREVYALPLALNWREVLLGKHRNLRSIVSPAADISAYCLKRWVVPRSERDSRYKDSDPRQVKESLLKDIH